MNFLLHLIGKTQHDVALRPTPRQSLLHVACREALAGNFAEAARAADQLAHLPGHRHVTEPLLRAHLHLAAHDAAAAAHHFAAGIAGLNDAQHSRNSCVLEFTPMLTTDTPRHGNTTRLEQLIDSADEHLRQGRYIRATELFQHARTLLDTLLSAQAGMIVADARLSGSSNPDSAAATPLVALANLGDLLLRMLARTHLASNLAAGLRERSLRDDLAPWATTGADVDELLRSECALLLESTKQNPDHAEMQYRLGLVARALGDRTTARRAFTRVLQLHPHHILSAARLAATLLQTDQPEAVMPLLAIAFTIPAPTLRNYQQLATTVANSRTFDRAVDRLCHDLTTNASTTTNNGLRPTPPTPATLRANLAFALAELGLLDEQHATWREPAPTV
jgi:tetratricopeptide (TPR) repeat protein